MTALCQQALKPWLAAYRQQLQADIIVAAEIVAGGVLKLGDRHFIQFGGILIDLVK